jgi:hypothetical protein
MKVDDTIRDLAGAGSRPPNKYVFLTQMSHVAPGTQKN